MARKYNNNTTQMGILPTGLRILAQNYPQHLDFESTNIVLKSGLRSPTTTPIVSKSPILTSSNYSPSPGISTNDGDYYSYKSCHSCNKPLSHDLDIYMYRGDHGFCSEECRNIQIKSDEKREMEVLLAKKKKKISLTSTDCRGCQTCTLLEDLRRQRHRRETYSTKDTRLFSLS